MSPTIRRAIRELFPVENSLSTKTGTGLCTYVCIVCVLCPSRVAARKRDVSNLKASVPPSCYGSFSFSHLISQKSRVPLPGGLLAAPSAGRRVSV